MLGLLQVAGGGYRDALVAKGIGAGIGVFIVFVIFLVLERRGTKTVVDPRTRSTVRRFFLIIALIAAFFVTSGVFGQRLGNFTVALGLIGAGVAVAAQELVMSVAGWLAILFADFFRTGDRVQLGSIRGDVIQITMMRTVLMEIGQWVKGDLYTGRIVRVANSFVFKEPVYNYSGNFPYIWDEFTVPVRYGSDRELARKILETVICDLVREDTDRARQSWAELARRNPIENARLDPMVTLVANDNWMEFTVRYLIHYKRRRTLQDEAFTRILHEVDATNGRVGLASATFQLVSPSALRVDLNTPRP
jgi:small-conductance mechanosensitive channel